MKENVLLDPSSKFGSVRIRLESYDGDKLSAAFQTIESVGICADGLFCSGPIRMPTSVRRWCVLKSPHVYKKSREHFEARKHRQIVDVYLQPNEIDQFGKDLNRIGLPPGVFFKIY